MGDSSQVDIKTFGAVCPMEGGTVRFPKEFTDTLGGTVLVVVNQDVRGFRVKSISGTSVWHVAVNTPAEGFSDFSDLIGPATSGLNLLMASERCKDDICTWEGFFSALDLKSDDLKERLKKSFEGSAVEVNPLEEGDRIDSPLSSAIIEKFSEDGVLDLSRLDDLIPGKEKVLAVLLTGISQGVLTPVSNDKIVHTGIFLENRPDVFAKLAMKLSDKGAMPIFTTGMCQEGNLCTWEAYIEVEKTKIYVEGKSKTDAVKDELSTALGALQGVREIIFQDLSV